MARKNRFRNSRTKRKGKGGFVLVVMLVIAAAIGGYLAVSSYREARRHDADREVVRKPLSAERHQMPEKKKNTPPVQESYTAAVIPLALTEKPIEYKAGDHVADHYGAHRPK